MQRTSFILGVALFVVAAALAITITLRRPAEPRIAALNQASTNTQGSRTLRPVPSASGFPTSDERITRGTSSRSQFSVIAPQSHPQSPQLSEKARSVEAESKAHLERLTEQLELTPRQRRKLFPILARTSKDYDPALVISGLQIGSSALSGEAGNKELNQVLDPVQREQLIEDAIADQALWEEIINKLRRRLDDEVPQVPTEIPADIPATVEPPVSTPRGRGNLFDTIDPQQ